MNELTPAAIAAALTTRRLGRPVLYLPTTGSTNDMAHQQALAGARDGALVLADEQTAGRGRLDRAWWAPPGSSLLLSLLLRPALPLRRAGQLTMCLGLGAVAGIEQATGLQARLKWPNDLVLNGRKLGGMLAELRADGERLDYAVLGLGLNVNVTFDEKQDMDSEDEKPPVSHPPSELADTAISLSMAAGRPVDRLGLLVAILAQTEVWYERLLAGESPCTAWAERLDTLGQRITVTLPLHVLTGIATGVTPEGALEVQDGEGRVHAVWTGDITSVRPAAG